MEVIALDVEHDPVAAHEACTRKRRLDVLRRLPLRSAGHIMSPWCHLKPAV